VADTACHVTVPASPHAGTDRRVLAGHGALALVQVGFGLFPVFGTLAFAPGGLSPLAVGAWRIVAGSLAIGTLAAIRHGRRAIPRRRHLPLLFACAMLGVAVNQGLYLAGLSRSTPMNAGLVMSLIPVFTFAIAAVARQEPFRPVRALGVAVALAGTLPLLFERGLSDLGSYGVGNLLMVANGLSYSAYLVLSKRLMREYSALVITAWSYLLSLVAVPAFALGQTLVPDPGVPAVWWSLAYILVVPTVVAYVLNMFALARLRASTVAVYVYSQPIISGLASWFVFGEHPTPAMLVAAAALFLGIWLVGRRPPPVQVVA